MADLEADNSPEDLMLAYVSAEKGRDRQDRELVTPWFKFLWELYRTSLEVLRNNNRLEALYKACALRAFAFCGQYKRTTEFRRLCEILRNHLANLGKFARDGPHRVDLAVPETMQLFLDTRFEQLRTATDLALWQARRAPPAGARRRGGSTGAAPPCCHHACTVLRACVDCRHVARTRDY